jgi:integrase
VGRIALDALARRRDAAEQEGHGSKYIFPTKTGGFPSRSNLRTRNFDRVCKTAKIKGLTPHGLRHSMTAHALASGVSPNVAAKRWATVPRE